tara:strand:+ start:144 stop:746 length:603 start_codon:yes stop_codon:yes gene_type:complete
MISQLYGNIVSVQNSFLILNVNNVGYKIFCPSRTLSTFKENMENVLILTELVVREDSLTLYGFSDELERVWFNLLQSVQGIGAKASLAILSSMTNEELSKAILSSDKAMISRAEGVGPKIAGRILNELKDKIPETSGLSILSDDLDSIENENPDLINDTISALTNLGYNRSESYKVVIKILKDNKDINISELITLCLKEL